MLFSGMNIFPLGGVQGVQHPTVPNVQYGVLCTWPYLNVRKISNF